VIYLFLLALQNAPPAGQLTLEDGARVTRVATVRVQIKVTSPGAGGLQMWLATDPKVAPAWTPFRVTAVVELPPGDGEKKVTLRLRDAAGAESEAVEAVIRLDTTPPIAKIEAPERVPGFSVRAVFDVADAVALQYTENLQSWSAWEPYTTPKTLPLSRGAGKKLLFLRFRDEAGNESLPGRIVVDAGSEAIDSVPGAGLRALLLEVRRESASALRLRLLVEGRGLVDTRVGLGGDDLQPRGPSQPEYSFQVPPSDGPRRITVTAWDAAGGEHRGEAVFQDRDAPVASPEDQNPLPKTDGALGLMAGVFPSGVDFNSSATIGNRKIRSGPMAVVRMEAEHLLVGPVFVKAAFEWADGQDVRVLWGGVEAGVDLLMGRWEGMDFEAVLGVGGYFSSLHVDVSNFGDFKDAAAFRTSAGVRARLVDSLWADLTLDWRLARYPFEETVLRGDNRATMIGAGLMAGLSWKF